MVMESSRTVNTPTFRQYTTRFVNNRIGNKLLYTIVHAVLNEIDAQNGLLRVYRSLPFTVKWAQG